ncbi:MAG: glutamate racemase [Oscillospiraceae bacterium]|nr:glutamate racemase [Oscillospiraceae bacterium]
MDNRPIGFFDSGLGGLTAVRALRRILPDENILYFGDTARMPYGARPAAQLRVMARQDLDFVASRGVKAVLAACGTVSSTAPDVLAAYPVRTFDVLSSTVREAARGASGPIGVIATAACIASGAFQRALAAACPETEVVAVACPAFVPLIESGHYESGDAALRAAVAEYLAPLREKGVGSLILGCTHYGLIEEAICGFMGPGLRTIEAAECAARELALWLRKEELCGGTGEERFFTSGSAEDFERLSAVFLGRTAHGAVEHVDEMEV